MCCNLAIFVKIARFTSLFLVVVFCRRRFHILKSNKNNFSIGQHVVNKCHWIRKSPFRLTLQNWPISHFLCKIAYTTLGGQQD